MSEKETKSDTSTKSVTRRKFLTASATAAVGPMILPSGVLATKENPGANDKLNIGVIGCGGQGGVHLQFLGGRKDVNIGAVCDVYAPHVQKGVDMSGGQAIAYTDYRKLLDQQDLDAALIAAPDHWHGLMAVDAAMRGLDVYCEKPASKTVEEGRAMLKAARRNKIVMQIGSQGRSTQAAIDSWNYIRNGNIGEVNKVVCWHEDNRLGGDPSQNQAPPADLDWNMWLGPAEWMAYNPTIVPWNFRWMLEFGGGQIRDRGAHVFSTISWILDLDDRSPVSISTTADPHVEGLWNCGTNFRVEFKFKKPDLTIIWEQPGTVPEKHNLGEGFHNEFGATYYGSKGKLIIGGGDGGCFAEEQAKNYTVPAKGEHAFESPGHHQNWFDCIKTREKPIMDIAAGHQVAKLCILANISYRIGRPVEWDGRKERIKNDKDANRLLGTPGRGDFHLES